MSLTFQKCAVFLLVTVLTGVTITSAVSHAESLPVALCGNNMCEEGENCASCFVDCGLCTSFEATPQELVCGNNICSANEDCMSCPDDCLPCLDAEAVRRIADRLHVYLAAPENSTLGSRFTQKDLERIERLRSATKLDFWTRSRVGNMLRALERAIEEETEDLSENFFALLQSKTLQERWPLLNTEKMTQALERRNLEELLILLPPSEKDLWTLSQELQKIAETFEEGSSLPISPSGSFIPKVSAAERITGLDPKERFETAVTLLTQVEEEAAEPLDALPSLQANLQYLLDHGESFHATTDLPFSAVSEKLSLVLELAGSTSFASLSDLMQSMRQLRRDAAFETAESSYREATHSLRSGVQQLEASVLSDKAVPSEAAEVLEAEGRSDVVEALSQDDLQRKKDPLLLLVREEREEIQALLENIEEHKRVAISDRLQFAEQALQDASSETMLRTALTAFNEGVQDAELIARAEAGVGLRFIYRMQDFLGIE